MSCHHKKKHKTQKKELEFKDDGQEYAEVTKIEGHGRCRVKCSDGVSRLAVIRGSMRKKVWIKLNDFVLVGLRDYQDCKCDIIGKYSDEDVRNLRAYGELPTVGNLEEEEEGLPPATPFDFDDI
mgnify:CR=1 FL=1|tara:strand:- start:187 stop:558 length:372 start_codon:yes stop_codon:yes gene_type:complete